MNLKSEEKLINVPNMLTLLNLILGFSAILYAKIDPAISFILIFTATVADALDGLAARVLKQTSKIGKELDSIADICSFGIAPAYLLLTIDFRVEAYIASIIYVCGGALRLARFNIYGVKEFFEGLPIPAAAIFSSSAAITLTNPYSSIIFIIVGFLMVSKIVFPSIKVPRGRISVLASLIIGVIATLITLYIRPPAELSLIFGIEIVFIVAICYVFLSPALELLLKKRYHN